MICSKKIKRKIHDGVLIIFTTLNFISLMVWICLIDAITSWQPFVIMAFNFIWLCLMAYANGCFYDTKPYYERLRKEKRHYELSKRRKQKAHSVEGDIIVDHYCGTIYYSGGHYRTACELQQRINKTGTEDI